MKRNKIETDAGRTEERLLARYKSVFDKNIVVYEFESHYKVFALTGTGEKYLGSAEKDRHELHYV